MRAKLSLLFTKRVKVTFKFIDGQWYCHIPGWPKSMFPRTLMVGQASQLIDGKYRELGADNNQITFSVYIGKKQKQGWNLLTKTYSSTIEGGFYKGCGFNNVWLCPVTLFVLGKYPEQIQFK